MTRRLLQSGAAFLPPLPAPLLPSGCSMAYSHGPASAADRARGSSVATRKATKPKASLQSLFEAGVIWRADVNAPREGSLVGLRPIETPQVAQPEGQEPGPKGTPIRIACVSRCLYLADRCDNLCAGCATAAKPRQEGAPLAGKVAAALRGRMRHPDGNHGDNLQEAER